MAIIKCVECGREISDKATVCPQCGCPISESIKASEIKQNKQREIIENAKTNFHCWKCNGTQFQFVRAYGSLMGKCPNCGGLTEICAEYDGADILDLPDESLKIDSPMKVECPYCHSTNTKKISGSSRVASFLTFGLASKKVGKQWHCNKCGSDF